MNIIALLLILEVNVSSILSLSMRLAIEFFVDVFYQIEEVLSTASLLGFFCHEEERKHFLNLKFNLSFKDLGL